MNFYQVSAPVQLYPQNPLQALLIAEAHLQTIGFLRENPQLSPLSIVLGQSNPQSEINAGIWPFTKLRVKDLLPGLKLRSGSSQLEIVKVMPSNKEIVYKNLQEKLFRVDAEKFVQLAIQQGYRKVWDLSLFLKTLKDLLKPVLAAIPLMWVLKLIVNSIRKKPTRFPAKLEKIEHIKLSSPKTSKNY